jgi:hypothetical protein
MSSCDHPNDPARSNVAAQPAEGPAFTLIASSDAAAVPPLAVTGIARIASIAHPPGGVADGTRLRI